VRYPYIDNWYNFSNYKYLSEDFIREFQDEVSWTTISINQKLSEPFIKEFQYKVNWEIISEYQNLVVIVAKKENII
jgi:hypothetical protein